MEYIVEISNMYGSAVADEEYSRFVSSDPIPIYVSPQIPLLKPMRSDVVKSGFERAPNRSLLRSLGITQREMDLPFIGIDLELEARVR